jgi:hypothetical protein
MNGLRPWPLAYIYRLIRSSRLPEPQGDRTAIERQEKRNQLGE